MDKDIFKGQYENLRRHQGIPPVKRPLSQKEAQIKQRFRVPAISGETPLAKVSDAVESIVAPGPRIDHDYRTASAPVKRHDPIGWLLKRFGVVFLIALTIGLLLLALPHGHVATSYSHPLRSRPPVLSPRTL